MKLKILSLVILNCFLSLFTGGQSLKVKVLTESTKTSLRGLSVANDKVIWVSGSNGMVGKSIDGGATWKWMVVKGFEKTDFRDIEAFDSMTALIMGIAEPAYILKTVDGGETWKVVLENKSKGMFLDAMEFWNEQNGIVLGDPIDNTFFIARTFDGGDTWQNMPEQNKLPADSGEACFASSGTNIRALNNNEAIFISGGLKSNLFLSNKKTPLPILQGKESTGANSIAIKNKKIFIVVGGDFMAKDSIDKNCCITKNGGLSWAAPVEPPHGYRSCVEYLGKSKWVCTGLNGVDYSENEGKIWKWISTQSFHVCKKAKKGNAVFFAGSNGKIGKLVFN